MAGFNLSAIGAGLGQGMQAIQQQNESRARLEAAAQLMQQQRRQEQARELMGATLAAGGIPGLGGMGGLGGLGNLPGAGPPQGMMPQAAAAQAQPAMPMPVAAPQQDTATGVMSLDDTPGSAAMAEAVAGEMGVPTMRADIGVPGSVANLATKQLDMQESQAAQPDAAVVTQPAEPAAAAAGGAGDMSHYLGMFRQVDPQAIARRIKEVRPDADMGAVGQATEMIYKMASGSWHEQATAASLMKFLAGDQTRREIASGSVGGAPTVAAGRLEATKGRNEVLKDQGAAKLEQGNRRLDQGDTKIQQGNRRLDQGDKRISERRYQQALARADGQSKLALSEMHRQLGDIKRRIDTIDTGPNATNAANKALRAQLQKQYDDIAAAEQKRADHVLGGTGDE